MSNGSQYSEMTFSNNNRCSSRAIPRSLRSGAPYSRVQMYNLSDTLSPNTLTFIHYINYLVTLVVQNILAMFDMKLD